MFHTNIKKRRATVLMLVFFLGYRQVKIGGIQKEENKSIKAQYPKSLERKRTVKDFEEKTSFLSLC